MGEQITTTINKRRDILIKEQKAVIINKITAVIE
jgi:hypothetical protein